MRCTFSSTPVRLAAVAALALALLGAGADVTSAANTPAASSGTCLRASGGTPHCYSPQQLRNAYGIAGLVAAGDDGSGQTVVLPETAAPHSQAEAEGLTSIHRDLQVFDERFGLRPVQLTIDRAPGVQPPTLATTEEVLDVEMVHTIAPGAKIRIYRTGDQIAGRGAAIAAAARRGDVVSVSYGVGGVCPSSADRAAEHRALEFAAKRRVTVLASSGDFGAAGRPCAENGLPSGRGVELPSSDPLVTAVGGTTLAAGAHGSYRSEIAWNGNARVTVASNGAAQDQDPVPGGATGGGFSHLFPTPSFQQGVAGIGSRRGVPDVAADADLDTGFPRVTIRHGRVSVTAVGGTSASTPLWAGIVALADQRAGHRLGPVNPALYRIARGANYHSAFHDVTAGSNTVTLSNGTTIKGYQAGPGWDPVTGLGSPDGGRLVPLLAGR